MGATRLPRSCPLRAAFEAGGVIGRARYQGFIGKAAASGQASTRRGARNPALSLVRNLIRQGLVIDRPRICNPCYFTDSASLAICAATPAVIAARASGAWRRASEAPSIAKYSTPTSGFGY